MFIEKLSLAGRSAIVVGGGGGGIGTNCAMALAEAGASVVVADIDEARANDAVTQIRDRGGNARAFVGDVRDGGNVRRLVDQANAAFGRLDVLVNVVGGTRDESWADALDFDSQVWDDDLTLNLKYAFLTCQAAAKVMAKQDHGGSIVNISSASGMRAATRHIAYGAAKAGIMSMTRTMAVEWGPYGIRVNSVAPGAIRTPKTSPNMQEGAISYLEEIVPLGRPGRPEDIAQVVLFLASDLAEYVTSQVIAVDGGVMATYPLGQGRRLTAEPQQN
ncbi:MAG: SDR family oxidoreductase [Chloroflexi bacterium]|nr:SDR family oxidoreductase [Chloroflexota bacterium]